MAVLSPAQRRRAFAALFTGVAVSTTGFLASNTVNGLIAEDLTGTTTWSGLPAAASVLGTAAGATALATVVRRVGPRTGLTLGYALATAATLIASIRTVLFAFGDDARVYPGHGPATTIGEERRSNPFLKSDVGS